MNTEEWSQVLGRKNKTTPHMNRHSPYRNSVLISELWMTTSLKSDRRICTKCSGPNPPSVDSDMFLRPSDYHDKIGRNSYYGHFRRPKTSPYGFFRPDEHVIISLQLILRRSILPLHIAFSVSWLEISFGIIEVTTRAEAIKMWYVYKAKTVERWGIELRWMKA